MWLYIRVLVSCSTEAHLSPEHKVKASPIPSSRYGRVAEKKDLEVHGI